MQTAQKIAAAQLGEVVDAIFVEGSPIVKQAHSDFDTPTRTFPTASHLREDLRLTSGQRRRFSAYAIYYPEAKGMVSERRIDLKADAIPGHTHRFAPDGWGLIQLQCDFMDYPTIECRVAVNSKVRAQSWSETYPEMGSPDFWNWAVVNHHAGRLTRLLRRLGRNNNL